MVGIREIQVKQIQTKALQPILGKTGSRRGIKPRMMKGRALGLLVLLALVLTAPLWSLGQPACADDCEARPCSYGCACCPCCQLQAARVTPPEIAPGLAVRVAYVQPQAALRSSEPRGVLHVPRSA